MSGLESPLDVGEMSPLLEPVLAAAGVTAESVKEELKNEEAKLALIRTAVATVKQAAASVPATTTAGLPLALLRHDAYFGVSYLYPAAEPLLKRLCTSAMALKSVHFERVPLQQPLQNGPIRVLVVSAQWKMGHAVYRNFAPAVRAMGRSEDMVVDLLFLESEGLKRSEIADRKLFREIYVVSSTDEEDKVMEMALEARSRGYDVVFYPQIGMHPWDVLLASSRIAPAQLTTYGHSSSSGSPVIDWFVGGWDVEMMPWGVDVVVGDEKSAEAVERNAQLEMFGHYAGETGLESEIIDVQVGPVSLEEGAASAVEAAGPHKGPVLAAATAQALIEAAPSARPGWNDSTNYWDNAQYASAVAILARANVSRPRLPVYLGSDPELRAKFSVDERWDQLTVLQREAGLQAGRRFSERLILLDGLGAAFDSFPVHPFPSIEPSPLYHPLPLSLASNYSIFITPPSGWIRPQHFYDKSPPFTTTNDDVLVIALAWSSPKLYAEHLATVGRALLRATSTVYPTRPILVRLFPAINRADDVAFATVAADAAEALDMQVQRGVALEVVPGLEYSSFLTAASKAAFAVDSYPFAGCNSLHDLLAVQVPVVTLEGLHWRSRVAAATLRNLSPELAWGVATTTTDLEDKIVQLIQDQSRLKSFKNAAKNVNLESIRGEKWAQQWPQLIRTAVQHLSTPRTQQ